MILKLSRLLRARLRGQDEGIAMIMVMGTIMVLTVLLGVTLAYALQVQPQARHDQDWNGALAAAQAGVDDYIAKLNQNDSYWSSVDCTNLALQGPKAGTNSCGWTSSTPPGWQKVDPGNTKAGYFHYDVDTSSLSSQGVIRVTSTGRVNGVDRSIQVLVSRGGSTQFLYYTDFEDADPANTFVYSSTPSAACGGTGPTNAKYWFQTRSGCVEIQFVAGDVLNGKAHFNDTPYMGGSATFKQGYETSDPKCANTPYNVSNCVRSGNATPIIGTGYKATYASQLFLPDNSDQFANYPGCDYTGDTRIRFNGDGTMTVWNTMSAGTSVTGPGTPSGTNCGVAANFKPGGTGTNPLAPASGQTVPVPNNLVIYVKNSSTTSACTPGQIVNGSASGSTAGDVIPPGSGSTVSGNTDISYYNPDSQATTSTYTFTRANTSSAWTSSGPTVVGPTPTNDTHPSTFNCGQGNVYLEGDLSGRVTVAAQNNIIVTNDLTLSTTTPATDSSGNVKDASGPDMMGLVAANSVIVYHPVSRSSNTNVSAPNGSNSKCSSSTTLGTAPSTSSSNGTSQTCTWTSTQTFGSTYSDISYPGQTTSSGARAIYASIQTLQHSFWVDNYKYGAQLGKLSVRGSIAQKWRGIVGQSGSSGTGYLKDYGYDTRLKYSSPPYFPQWTNARWSAQTTGELSPQY
ncbi:MAG TPA: hypothetical protein VMI11_08535 [Actinomycetes bacterium]|nr:hypothetical protein [Actinomycetes bacterium]